MKNMHEDSNLTWAGQHYCLHPVELILSCIQSSVLVINTDRNVLSVVSIIISNTRNQRPVGSSMYRRFIRAINIRLLSLCIIILGQNNKNVFLVPCKKEGWQIFLSTCIFTITSGFPKTERSESFSADSIGKNLQKHT